MPDAASLHCPNCGAAATPDAGRCPYCQARLATVSCPACFGLLFDGARYCPHCGARRERSAADDTGKRCPACDGGLQRVEVGATPLLECAACDGVWVDAEEFERLCGAREARAAVLHRFRARGTPPAGPFRYRRCVRCGTMMNRVNFGRASGAVVDVCRGHGTFLDAGELHHIVTFIEAGGLDRSRERQLEELREERQRLADAEGKLARERLLHAGNAGAQWTSGNTTGVDLRALLALLKR